LHLKVGSPPVTRVQGLLTPVEGYGVLDPPDTEAFLSEILP
jgi:twitching motility protein PilT